MALKNNYVKKLNGFSDAVANDAYTKIDRIDGTKDKINVYTRVFSDENKSTLLDENVYSFDVDLESSDNFIKQGYAHIKSLDSYSSATDC